MMNPLGIYQEWTHSVIGEKLSGVKGKIYSADKLDFKYPQQLQLIFSNAGGVVNVKCGAEDSSLELTYYSAQGNDLNECDNESLVDISHYPLFINYFEKTVLTIYSVFSIVENAHVGIKLIFDDQSSLVMINIGNKLNVLDSLPSSYEQDENIQYQVL